jgi:hypothetical protein
MDSINYVCVEKSSSSLSYPNECNASVLIDEDNLNLVKHVDLTSLLASTAQSSFGSYQQQSHSSLDHLDLCLPIVFSAHKPNANTNVDSLNDLSGLLDYGCGCGTQFRSHGGILPRSTLTSTYCPANIVRPLSPLTQSDSIDSTVFDLSLSQSHDNINLSTVNATSTSSCTSYPVDLVSYAF